MTVCATDSNSSRIESRKCECAACVTARCCVLMFRFGKFHENGMKCFGDTRDDNIGRTIEGGNGNIRAIRRDDFVNSCFIGEDGSHFARIAEANPSIVRALRPFSNRLRDQILLRYKRRHIHQHYDREPSSVSRPMKATTAPARIPLRRVRAVRISFCPAIGTSSSGKRISNNEISR